ncbi:MAG: hypothetical protein AAGA68_02240 [Pseudomonadota bacterium]
MTPLTLLLLVMIAVTAVVVAAPLLLLAPQRLDELSGAGPGSALLYRLYGVAISALLVAYGAGALAAQAGVFPAAVVAMGIVSNAGAAAVLIVHPEVRKRAVGIAFFGVIAVGLAVAAFAPEWATTRFA